MKSNKEFVTLSSSKVEMKSVNVQLSDLEFKQLGPKKISKYNLKQCVQLSENRGLSKMIMEEINAEIRAERNAPPNS